MHPAPDPFAAVSGTAPLPTAAPALAQAGQGAVPRPGLIHLNIREASALYAAYVPLFAQGGIFIPTTRDYRLGDTVRLQLTLPQDPQRHELTGAVAWINPARASGHRAQGIAVRFPDNEGARDLRHRIEAALGSMLDSERPTQTI